MNSILTQISLVTGVVLCVLALVTGVASGVSPLTASYRAILVFCVGSVLMAFFLRCFSNILHGFIREQLLRKAREAQEAEAAKTAQQPKQAGA